MRLVLLRSVVGGNKIVVSERRSVVATMTKLRARQEAFVSKPIKRHFPHWPHRSRRRLMMASTSIWSTNGDSLDDQRSLLRESYSCIEIESILGRWGRFSRHDEAFHMSQFELFMGLIHPFRFRLTVDRLIIHWRRNNNRIDVTLLVPKVSLVDRTSATLSTLPGWLTGGFEQWHNLRPRSAVVWQKSVSLLQIIASSPDEALSPSLHCPGGSGRTYYSDIVETGERIMVGRWNHRHHCVIMIHSYRQCVSYLLAN